MTSKEFIDKVRAKYPHKWESHYIDWLAYEVIVFLDTLGETKLPSIDQLRKASHAWCSRNGGELMKDSDGLFGTQHFTPTGVFNITIPSPNQYYYTIGGGSSGGSVNGPGSVNAGLPGGSYIDPEPYQEKAKQPIFKCCCGAHSVGSNKHSNWCDIKEGA